jgi:hypothetical protein
VNHKIELNIDLRGRGSILLDGRPVACRAIRISGRAGQPNKVTLQLLADVSGSVEFDHPLAGALRNGLVTHNEARKELDGDEPKEVA